jgi:hypothetical protein
MYKPLFVLALSLAAWAGDTHYNIPLWEPGKVPMAAGDGPLDAPFLTVSNRRRARAMGPR